MSQPYAGFDPQFDPYPGQPGMPKGPAPVPVAAPASGLAITSLVMAILGWTALFGIGWIVSIVTGHIALGQIRRDPYRYGGRGLAIAGLVISYVSTGLALLAVVILTALAIFFVGAVSSMDLDKIRLEYESSGPVAERVVSILAEEVHKPADEITPELSLTDDLKLEELDVVELVLAVEEEFGITIEDAEVDQLRTVQDLIDLVERKQGEKAAMGVDPENDPARPALNLPSEPPVSDQP